MMRFASLTLLAMTAAACGSTTPSGGSSGTSTGSAGGVTGSAQTSSGSTGVATATSTSSRATGTSTSSSGTSSTTIGTGTGSSTGGVLTGTAAGTTGGTGTSGVATGTTTGGVPDSGVVCVTGEACANGALAEVCENGNCGACADTTDDQSCLTAYGETDAGADAGPFLCVSGSCTQGNCHNDTQCALGQICGLTQSNFCGGCTNDTECQSDPTYGTATICNTNTGTCISSACTSLGDGGCASVNTSDDCCAVTGGKACVYGNCCQNTDCALGSTCQSHVCSQCLAAVNGTYYVDPRQTSDAAHTGGQNCAFDSVTHALLFIGAAPTSAATIIVTGASAQPFGSLETFPLNIPVNVTIEGDSTLASPPVLTVPSGQTGFVLSGASSGVTNLVLNGASAGAVGISVLSGATTTTAISKVTVENFTGAGISVRNGSGKALGPTVSIGPSVVSTRNGDGLLLDDSASATVTDTTAQTSFNGNSNHGILVLGNAAVAIDGAPDAGGGGTVVANGNAFAGVWIQQNPNDAGTNPQNVLDGVVTYGSATGNGIHLFAGSNVRIRNSVSLNNKDNGVVVSSAGSKQTGVINDVSQIDLGSNDTTDPGNNTLQALATGAANGEAGICLAVQANSGATLKAEGNIFQGPVDCATQAATLVSGTSCKGGVDVAVSGGSSTSTATIDVNECH